MNAINKISLHRRAMLCLLGVVLLLTGCIKEDCQSGYRFIVKSFDSNNNDITGTGVVNEVVLYVFDNNNVLIDVIHTVENALVSKDYPSKDKITVVAWGNSAGTGQQMPNVPLGTSLTGLSVLLNKADASGVEPGDLFYGMKDVYSDTGKETNVIVKRKVASITVVLKNLREWYGSYDSDYSIFIGQTSDAIGFDGILRGDKVGYWLPASFNAAGDFVTPIFRTFASGGEPITVDIYKGNQKIYAVSIDEQGSPFRLDEDKLLKVQVEFKTGHAAVDIVQAEWGESDIEQEF